MGLNLDNLDFKRAVALLRLGDPIPIDLHARLINEGYDVETMEQTYGKFPQGTGPIIF